MFSFFLTIHITGAVIFSVALLTTAVVLLRSFAKGYRLLSQSILWLTVLQLGTGTVLYVLSPDGILPFCGKAFTYLAMAGVAEYLLAKKMHEPVAALLLNRSR
jgi:hypothetical protein